MVTGSSESHMPVLLHSEHPVKSCLAGRKSVVSQFFNVKITKIQWNLNKHHVFSKFLQIFFFFAFVLVLFSDSAGTEVNRHNVNRQRSGYFRGSSLPIFSIFCAETWQSPDVCSWKAHNVGYNIGEAKNFSRRKPGHIYNQRQWGKGAIDWLGR